MGREQGGFFLKQRIGTTGYFICELCKHSKAKTFKVHQLVAIAFLNHTPCGFGLVINHINHNPQNNRVDNLEIVTQRENTNQKHLKSTSKYIGVFYDKSRIDKWGAAIYINPTQINLGRFRTEIQAAIIYNTALINKKLYKGSNKEFTKYCLDNPEPILKI